MKSTQLSMTKPQNQESTYSQIIRQMEDELALNCFICSHTFNTTNRVPTIVCRRQHTYCAECVTLIQRARPNRCPECRFKIYQENIFINRSLVAICNFFPQLKQAVDSLVKQNEGLTLQNMKLKTKIQQMNNHHECELEAVRRTIRQEGMNLKQRQERLFTIAKQKYKETKKSLSEIVKQEEISSTAKTNKVVNPEEKKGLHQLKLKRKYTKPNASTDKRRPESPFIILEPMIHRYRLQT